MLTKEFKYLLNKNINCVKIRLENELHIIEELDVMDVKFNIVSRKELYLEATRFPKPRVNKFYAIKSFSLDFSDNREVLVFDKDKNKIYAVLSDYSLDELTNELTLNLGQLSDRIKPFKIRGR